MTNMYPATTPCRAKWKAFHNHPCFCAVPAPIVQDEFTNLPTQAESDRIERQINAPST